MLPGDPENLSDADWNRLQEIIARFETAWRDELRPKISEFLPDRCDHRDRLLIELVHTDMEFRLKAGDSARVEDYLRRYPTLARDRSQVVELIRAEWSFRRRREPKLKLDRYRERFPDYVDDLNGSKAEPSTLSSLHAGVVPSTAPPQSSTPAHESTFPRRLGKFELRRKLGAGSFGIVYLAWDTVLNREVALKIPRPETIATSLDVRGFLREARNAINLSHPHIVAIHDAGPIEGTVCLVRAYIAGATLAERVREEPFSFQESAALMILVLEALDYAHGRGVYHRDLKPSNILLDEDGRPHVSDFGLAKRESGDSTLCAPGQGRGNVVGTPAYMPPEQARGDGYFVDGRSDIYSAGVVLYELLTGSVPFRGRGRMLLLQIQEAEPPRPRTLNEEIPTDLETICLKALAKDPAQRYPTARMMADELRSYLEGRSIFPELGPRRRGVSISPARAMAWLGAVTVAVGLLTTTTFWWRAERFRSQDVAALTRTGRALLDLARDDDRGWDQIRAMAPGLDADPLLVGFSTEVQARLAARSELEGTEDDAETHWANAAERAEASARAEPDRLEPLEAQADVLEHWANVHRRGRLTRVPGPSSVRLLELREQIHLERKALASSRLDDPDAQLDLAEATLRLAAANRSQTSDLTWVETTALGVDLHQSLSAGSLQRLGRLAIDLARWDLDQKRAESAGRAARQALRLFQQSPPGPDQDRAIAGALVVLGRSYRDLGRPIEAAQEFRRASRRFESLQRLAPTRLEDRRAFASLQLEMGRLFDRPAQRPEAIVAYERALRVRRDLARAYPGRAANLDALAQVRSALSAALGAEGRPLAAGWHGVLALSDWVQVFLLDPRRNRPLPEIVRQAGDLLRLIPFHGL